MIGSKVIGIWGAMFPWSHGKIVSVEDGWAEIEWEEPMEGPGPFVTKVVNIKPNYKTYKPGPGESPIGIYFDDN